MSKVLLGAISPERVRPTVAITNPGPGSNQSGTITLIASATDSSGIAGVQFYLDGSPYGSEDTTSPYQINLDTTAITAGNHTVYAIARDVLGNTQQSPTITFNVLDQTNPTVSISSHSENQTVTGTITVTATASDNVGVAWVQFYLDGSVYGGQDTTAPYQMVINTASYSAGTHTIIAIASDAQGNTNSTTIHLIFADQSAPAVSFTSHTDYQNVTGTITLVASASDNVGVAGVQFKMDGSNFGAEDTSAPYQAVINTASYSAGTHTFDAIARDAAGNTTTVTIHLVFADQQNPSVNFTSHSNNQTVGETITVIASASDNVGVVGVQFKIDGVNYGAEDTSAPYQYSIDTHTLANGGHSFQAVARDAAGNTATATITLNVSNGIAGFWVGVGQFADQGRHNLPTTTEPWNETPWYWDAGTLSANPDSTHYKRQARIYGNRVEGSNGNNAIHCLDASVGGTTFAILRVYHTDPAYDRYGDWADIPFDSGGTIRWADYQMYADQTNAFTGDNGTTPFYPNCLRIEVQYVPKSGYLS